MRALVRQIDLGYAEGHEIGTHYNGHFCEPYPGNISTWSRRDWRHEIGQFHKLMHHAGLAVPASEIRGGRTPCLQGHLGRLYPVLRSEGMTYDTSQADLPGDWPRRRDGIWSFPLALIKLVGTPWRSLSMDYNFYVNQSGARTVSRRRSRVLADDVFASYMRYFRANYHGDRAPIDVGNHFATWNHGAYVDALTRFVDTVCDRPEVRCVTYSTLVAWLNAQPRRWLARDRAGRFPRDALDRDLRHQPQQRARRPLHHPHRIARGRDRGARLADGDRRVERPGGGVDAGHAEAAADPYAAGAGRDRAAPARHRDAVEQLQRSGRHPQHGRCPRRPRSSRRRP